MKRVIKHIVRPVGMPLHHLLQRVEQRTVAPPATPCDNTYDWLNYAFHMLNQDPRCRKKPMYVWGVLQGAVLARVLNVPHITAIEFGVAGGNGLIALECIAKQAEESTGVAIDVYGFDSGVGLPKPTDYRDQPNMWFEGQLPMNVSQVAGYLRGANLKLGLVERTVPRFMAANPAPVGFVSFDLDLYSSTRSALEVFEGPLHTTLPRVPCYFDDILGHSYSRYTGERLAIEEFNSSHPARKLEPVYGLRYFVAKQWRSARFWDQMYWAHFFEHRQYNTLDSYRKAVFTDEVGMEHRHEVESDWRSRIPGLEGGGDESQAN